MVYFGGLNFEQVKIWMQPLVVIMVGRSAVVWCSEVTAHRLATGIKTDVRQRLLTCLLELGPIYTRGQQTGELVNVLVEGIENLEPYLQNFFPIYVRPY